MIKWHVAAVAALALVRGVLQAPAAQPAEVEYRGFVLSAGTCAADDGRCGRKGPKEWAVSETDAVKRAIDEILAGSNGPAVTLRAQRRGGNRLRRYSAGLDDRGMPIPDIEAAWVTRATTTAIDIYDRALAKPDLRDRFSGQPGYLLVAKTLLHECFHGIDEFSAREDFAAVVGFVKSGSRWRFAVDTPEEIAALTEFKTELTRMRSSGDATGPWELNRRLALAMKPVRVPTMASIGSPAEAFAEIGAHMVLDPRARKYLPREIIAYFDAHVFKPVAASRR